MNSTDMLRVHLDVASELEKTSTSAVTGGLDYPAILLIVQKALRLDACFLLLRSEDQPDRLHVQSSTADKLTPFKSVEFDTDKNAPFSNELESKRLLKWQMLKRRAFEGKDRLWELVWQSMHLGPYAGPWEVAAVVIKPESGVLEGMLILVGRSPTIIWNAELECGLKLLAHQLYLAAKALKSRLEAESSDERQRSDFFKALLRGGQEVMLHGVFAPLQTIELRVHLAKMSLGEAKRTMNSLDIIRGMCTDVTKLVRSFLQLSQNPPKDVPTVGDRPTGTDTWVNVKQSVDEVCATLTALARISSMEFLPRLDSPHTFPMLKGGFDDILSNLLHNAVKYGHTGTKIKVNLHRSQTHVMLDVTSYGLPIRDDDRSRVFELGYRTRESISKHFNAVGIGLYHARRIAQRAGAELFVTASEATDSESKTFRNTFRLRSKL